MKPARNLAFFSFIRREFFYIGAKNSKKFARAVGKINSSDRSASKNDAVFVAQGVS
jgi:hypothetical protein